MSGHGAEKDAVLNDMLGALGKAVGAARAERQSDKRNDVPDLFGSPLPQSGHTFWGSDPSGYCACQECEPTHPVPPAVHDHPPYRPICNERSLPDGQLRGACLNDDGASVIPPTGGFND